VRNFSTFFLVAVLLKSTIAFAGDSLLLIKEIPIEAQQVTNDQLGNTYVVADNHIYKYSRAGDLVQKYSNNNFGQITSIDATDPYKTIVFYQDFRHIIILDNMLSDNASPIDLQFTQFDQPVLACRAYNTGIWLFDQLLNDIYRLTLKLETVQSTGNLSQVLGYQVLPNYMTEYNNLLYLNNPESGILIFDQYGNLRSAHRAILSMKTPGF